MSVIRVKEFLKEYGLENDIITFDDSSKTVSEAAKRLNCEEEKIAKTLSFYIKDIPILIVMKGDSKIDNKKFKDEFKEKAKMIPYDEVEEKIGHVPGGVCPFGVFSEVKIFLDESLKKFDYVYPACGEANNAIKISVKKLNEILKVEKWVDVTK